MRRVRGKRVTVVDCLLCVVSTYDRKEVSVGRARNALRTCHLPHVASLRKTNLNAVQRVLYATVQTVFVLMLFFVVADLLNAFNNVLRFFVNNNRV